MTRCAWPALLVACLLWAPACSGPSASRPSDAGPGGDGGSGGADGGGITTRPDDLGPPACDGCVTAAGNCLAGDTRQACGRAGGACSVCDEGTQCSSGACAVPPACLPSNCDGCCTTEDTCAAGGELSACGAAGRACELCDAGEACVAGACKPACGPDTCNGCCSAMGECLPGSAAEACGERGAECATCGPSARCSGGACVAVTCAESCDGCCTASGECQPGTAPVACGTAGGHCQDCGAGHTCSSARCALDLGSVWNVRVVNAEVNQYSVSGSSWDSFGGLPDPYVEVYVESGEGESAMGMTAVQSDNLSPAFGETTVRGVPARWLMNYVRVRAYDSDWDWDEYIGGCYAALTAGAFRGELQVFECARSAPDQSAGATVRIRIEP